MSDILISIGGSGAGSDECTVTKDKVLSGQTYIGADTNDEPIAGTMPNQGAKTATLNAGGSYTIPAGYHNGAGKVTANTLSGQTAGTAVAANIRNGKTAWVNGAKVTGNMPEQVGSTITPGTANKTVVAANRYVTGNIIVAGDKNLIPANVKKDVVIFGVRGTAEGYVPGTLDIYKRGAWGSGYAFSNLIGKGYATTNETSRLHPPVISQDAATVHVAYNYKSDTGSINNNRGGVLLNKYINMSPYKSVSIVFALSSGASASNPCKVYMGVSNAVNNNIYDNTYLSVSSVDVTELNKEYTVTTNLSNITSSGYIVLYSHDTMPYQAIIYIKQIYFT